MFVITRNGSTQVVSGWRAWLMFALLCVVGALVLAAMAFLLFGITITIAAIIVIGVPVAIAGALIAEGVRSVRGR